MGFRGPVLVLIFCTLLTGYVVVESAIEAFDELRSLGPTLHFHNLDEDDTPGENPSGEDPLSGKDPLVTGDGDSLLGDPDTLEEVMEKLKVLGITPEKLFAARNKQGIKVLSNLEHLGKWMNGQIATEFQDKNPNVVYQLLGRCADLLQIANVGCFDQRCSTPVLEVHRKYQDMMYEASKISYNGILMVIKLMKYFRHAIIEPQDREKILTQTVPITKKFASSYRKLSNMAEDLKDLSVKTFTDTNILRQSVIEKIQQIDNDYRNVTNVLAGQKERKKKLMEQVKETAEEIKKMETEYKNLASICKISSIRFPQPIRGMDNTRGAYIQGHVEIFHSATWGTICDDHFNNNGARVLCRMMNYADGEYNSVYRQSSLTPSSKIWLDDVRCSGTESDINDCPRSAWGSHNCGHSEDIAIRCYATTQPMVQAFKAVGILDPVPSGWRLARRKDVQDNYELAKSVVGKESTWVICKLQDGSMKGRGYGYVVERQYPGGWGEKLLVRSVPGNNRFGVFGDDLDKLTNDMEDIQTRLRETRPRYVKLLERLTKMKREKVDVFGMVAKNMDKLESFSDTKSGEERVADSLQSVIESLKLIKTIIVEGE